MRGPPESTAAMAELVVPVDSVNAHDEPAHSANRPSARLRGDAIDRMNDADAADRMQQ